MCNSKSIRCFMGVAAGVCRWVGDWGLGVSFCEQIQVVFFVYRSFRASWGSFLILRAELEGFEELVRMGVWDFSFIISASDLPLRSVDDMAAMLAPYRGGWRLWVGGRLDLTLKMTWRGWEGLHAGRVDKSTKMGGYYRWEGVCI